MALENIPIIGGLFASKKQDPVRPTPRPAPQAPVLAAPPPTPTRDDPGIDAAKEKRRRDDALRRQASATVLTGGLGAPDIQGSIRRPSLLGNP